MPGPEQSTRLSLGMASRCVPRRHAAETARYRGRPAGRAWRRDVERVLSGIKPTGDVHLGNYVGALRQWVADQDEYDCFYSIVDLHAITVPQDPTELREATLTLAAWLFAVGLDPER